MSAIELSYREIGSGIPVVLLHAFPLSSALFDALGELPGYRLVLPDLRGFGASPLGGDEPSLAAMADDVVALLDRMDLATAVVGGVSMGGYVTMELMRQAPQRLGGVVLIDTKAQADQPAARDGRLVMARDVLTEGRAVLEPMIHLLLGETSRSSRPGVVSTVSAWLDDADPRSVAWAQRAMAARPESFATLADASLPGAVVVGEEDWLSPPAQAWAMAERLGTEPHVVPGTGHLAVVEDPSLARSSLVQALDTVTAGS